MKFDPQKVLRKAGQTDTQALLDRVTVLREGMEPEAVDIFVAELARRGIGPEEIDRHDRELKHRVVRREDGLVGQCTVCSRAATDSRLDWHRLWGLLPLFKRRFYYCDRHAR